MEGLLSQLFTGNDPCANVLEAYVQCMDEHEGVAPALYEAEWCDVEKNEYHECRQALKEAKQSFAGWLVAKASNAIHKKPLSQ
jgi:hypothetical protein